MRTASIAVALLLAFASLSARQAPLKVFISVDMEGLAGVVTNTDVSPTGPDYAQFRAIMAAETNAAVEGAFTAGATGTAASRTCCPATSIRARDCCAVRASGPRT